MNTVNSLFEYDLCIIGGGINGAGIARDAAGHGIKTILLEQDDLAAATSSASTKLIHGGLRYLEYYEFRLVYEALHERDVLLAIAPHIIWPMNFILPDAYGIRPFWMIRAGLYLYDLLSFSLFKPRLFPASRAFNLRRHAYGDPLKDEFLLGVLYSDGWVQDSRLVVLNAMDAKSKGAEICTHTKCTGLSPVEGGWEITASTEVGEKRIRAKMVVNAAGPWARDVLEPHNLTRKDTPDVRLVQGSHIVVRKIHNGDQAYMLQQADKRIIFAIPYENDFTLIGTTDTDYHGDPKKPEITSEEKKYLLEAANTYFKRQLTEKDIVWEYSGVRPLMDDERGDAKSVSRDYKIHEDEFNGSRLISVFGGKITTYRKLSEAVLKIVTKDLSRKFKSWTGKRPLPGGDIPSGDINAFLREQKIRWEQEPVSLLKRYARNYGTKMIEILSSPRGEDYGDGVFEREIRYLVSHEFAQSMDDILWRRSKLGLHVSDLTKYNIEKALPKLLSEKSL